MTAPKQTDQLVATFANDVTTYERMSIAVAHLLSQIISSEGLIVHSVTHRCKAIDSLSKKVGKPDKAYQSLDEVTDLAGVRVTTYFSEDVGRVARLIEQEFAIDKANSVDKRATLDPDRFGYQSLHYVAQFDVTRSRLVEYKTYSGKKFEIQIRSILQHAWAEIEHDLGYKSAVGVPKEIRRRFARVAGLLEVADDEFVALRAELRRYEEEIGKKIASNPDDVGLDLPSLRSAYSSESAIASLDRAIADKAGAQLGDLTLDTLERALNRLLYVGIDKVAQLEKSTKENLELATRFAERWMDRKYEHLPAGVGVFYLAYVLMAAKNDKAAFMEYLAHFNIGLTDTREDTAERALTLMAELQSGKLKK